MRVDHQVIDCRTERVLIRVPALAGEDGFDTWRRAVRIAKAAGYTGLQVIVEPVPGAGMLP